MEMTPKKSPNKWLLGLGIGCGAVVVIVIVLVIVGYMFVRNATQAFKVSDEMMKSLEARYGRVEAYCPDAGGAVAAARLEVFLAVRGDAGPARAALEGSLQALAESEKEKRAGGEGSKNVFRTLKTGLAMVPQISDFMKIRARAMLDRGMGEGEYYYLYMIAYHAWLKKPVLDASAFQFRGPGRDSSDPDDQDTLAFSRDMILARAHRLVLPMLKCQLAKLDEGRPGGGAAPDKWREALAAEIKAMEADRSRLPWRDGVPETIESSLRPWREKLEAGYSPLADVFEISRDERRKPGAKGN
jgi:hypothetical protein